MTSATCLLMEPMAPPSARNAAARGNLKPRLLKKWMSRLPAPVLPATIAAPQATQMPDPKPDTTRTGSLTDARSREVTQVDFTMLSQLARDGSIDPETLKEIATESGVSTARRERVILILVLAYPVLVICVAIVGILWGAPLESLLFGVLLPSLFIFGTISMWRSARSNHRGKFAPTMLKHSRCPHCGYDLRGLPTDPGDHATVCPECGCAWRLKRRIWKRGAKIRKRK